MTVEAERFFLGLNVRLYSGYGLSEASGSHFVSSPNNYRLYRYGPTLARAPWCPPAEWVPECQQFRLGPSSPARPQSHGGGLCRCHPSLWLKAA